MKLCVYTIVSWYLISSIRIHKGINLMQLDYVCTLLLPFHSRILSLGTSVGTESCPWDFRFPSCSVCDRGRVVQT